VDVGAAGGEEDELGAPRELAGAFDVEPGVGFGAELVDLAGVAVDAGLAGPAIPNAVSVYARRYPTFPAPALSKGRCVLWLRSDVEAWSRARRNR
jgi:predicted DNA-binding transcriptional regulator AlpA